jgi:hypothetical protein
MVKNNNLTNDAMKRVLMILMIAPVLFSCTNQEKIFPDYDYNAVYFPIQYPVRTLSLGEDRIDNPLDRELKFHIGVSIGGMYENTEDWLVEFVYDESLAQNLETSTGDTIMIMPESYYSMSPTGSVTIPVGSFSGLIQIQLEEAFLDDPLSIGRHYVIPLRITDTDADSILSGFAVSEVPDKRVADDWMVDAPPRDFTLFMVKYVNQYHGRYLRRGTAYKLDGPGGQIIDTTVYRNKYVEKDQVVTLITKGRYTVQNNFIGKDFGAGYAMRLIFDDQTGAVQIDTIADQLSKPYSVGESQFVKNGGTWGDLIWDAIFLNYEYVDRKGDVYLTFDTLVFRDRGLGYEEYIPVVVESE